MKKIILISSKIFLFILIAVKSYGAAGNHEMDYFRFKGNGNSRGAIKALQKWTLGADDPVILETNIFRINELLIHPELISGGINAFEEIKKYPLIAGNKFLLTRIDTMLALLYLKHGRLKEAGGLIKINSFMEFDILGPFSGNSIDEYERHDITKIEYDEKKIYAGTHYHARWIKGYLDRIGTMNIKELLPDTMNSFFYFHKDLHIPGDGEYNLILGKTGFTDISINGIIVFSNRDRHYFNYDQYFLKLWMPKGRHKILIKSGDTGGNIQLSMRITDKSGNPLLQENSEPHAAAEPVKLLEASLFPSLAKISGTGSLSEEEAFMAGYLNYISSLAGDDNSNVIKYFSGINKKNHLYLWASYYSGKSEKSGEKKERYFLDALSAGDENIDPLMELINIKLSKGFYYEAFPMIERIKEEKKNPAIYNWLMAKILYEKKWTHESLKYAEKLLTAEYPSLGHSILYRIHIDEKLYLKAVKNLNYLAGSDRYDKPVYLTLYDCYKKTGDYEKSVNLLEGLSGMFRNDAGLKLELAKTADYYSGPEAAIPYLAASLKISPNNKKTLYQTGINYHKLGKQSLAKYYMRLASFYDPDNYEIKRYLEAINGDPNEIREYLFTADTGTLAQKAESYRNEPAVVLLSETGIRVNSDGSHEKWRRKIVKINDENTIKNFNTQYIIIDPNNETIENMNCLVINEGNAVNNSERFRKSLSDPESKLYYNLEAIVVPVNSLKKGSILDFSYTVKNISGRDYFNHFGEKIVIGGEYRTLLTNIVLSHDSGKKIYFHKKDIDDGSVKKIIGSAKNIYQIRTENRLPYKKEEAMPFYTDILPVVYFTSHKNWDEVYSWYKSLLRKRIRTSPEMKKNLNDILTHGDSDMEKIRKIYNHVTENIRYVGFELGIGGIQPREADQTYISRMGDCKDMTLVLVALLREAGIDSRLALVRTREKGKANITVPYIGDFNHAICYVKLDRGASGPVEFFLDGTAEDSGFRELPEEIWDATAFVLDEKNYHFINTKSGFYIHGIQNVSTRVTMDGNGNADLERSLIISGNSAPDARSNFKNEGNKLIMLNEYWNKRFPGAGVSELKIDVLGKENPVSYSYKIRIPSFAQLIEEEMIFKSFLIPTDYYRGYGLLRQRNFPVMLASRADIKESIEYIIPKGFKVLKVPDNIKFTGKKFSFAFNYYYKENILKAESAIIINEREITRDEYLEFREFSKIINKKEMERVIMIKE